MPYAGDECFSNYGAHYVPDGVTERVRSLKFFFTTNRMMWILVTLVRIRRYSKTSNVCHQMFTIRMC